MFINDSDANVWLSTGTKSLSSIYFCPKVRVTICGGFTRPIPGDGNADQFRGVPIVGRLPTDGTRGPEEKGCGRKWPDAEGLVQGSRTRDVRDPVVQNHIAA